MDGLISAGKENERKLNGGFEEVSTFFKEVENKANLNNPSTMWDGRYLRIKAGRGTVSISTDEIDEKLLHHER